MLAFQAFHLAAYHFAHGTFQPTAAGSALGCSELDSLLGGGPGPVDLNAAVDVCFDAQFSCSHAEVQSCCAAEASSPANPDSEPKPNPNPDPNLDPEPNTLPPNPAPNPNPNPNIPTPTP